MNTSIGVIHGRFQPVHKGHVEYLLAGLKRCDRLLIGLSNPDPGLTLPDGADGHRHRPEANPFTYYERFLMLQEVLLAEGAARESFAVVPFPINNPELLKFYVPFEATFFITIYDEWGERKLKTLTDLGLTTEVMWRRHISDRLTTGTEVRELMRRGSERWRDLVPPAVCNLFDQGKIKSLAD